MPLVSQSHQSWVRIAAVATFVASWAVAVDAYAVLLYATATRNTSAPSEELGLDGWNLEAQWGSFLATPIDSTHFIAAAHVGNAASSIVFQGVTYPVNLASRARDTGSDMAIYSLESGSAFPTYATLYDAAIDGSEVGKTLTVIGRGTQRGSGVYVAEVLKGWQWGADDRVQAWGQNVVSGFVDYSTTDDSLFYFDFNSDGLANEASISVGDSSGGVFINVNGQWKLAGINYAVDSPFSLTGAPEDTGFKADIFDARGLYYKNEQEEWTLVPADDPEAVPGASYASRISARLDWIRSKAPGVVTPEPSSLLLATVAAILLGVFNWRARRRAG